MEQILLAWALKLPEISSTIMGASKPEQVAVNAGASDDNDVVDQIEQILNNKPVSPFR